jgi:hypothetical protein
MATNHMNGVAANGNGVAHGEQPTELQRQAQNIASLTKILRALDLHKVNTAMDAAKAGDFERAMEDLESKFIAIAEVMTFYRPVGLTDCLILAVIAHHLVSDALREPDEREATRKVGLADRAILGIIGELERQAHVTADALGLGYIYADYVNSSEQAFKLYSQISGIDEAEYKNLNTLYPKIEMEGANV